MVIKDYVDIDKVENLNLIRVHKVVIMVLIREVQKNNKELYYVKELKVFKDCN